MNGLSFHSPRFSFGPFALFPLLVCIAAGSSQAGFAADQKALLLQQRQYIMGDIQITICPVAIKIVNLNQGYEFISKSPKWEVDCFRRDDKVVCHLSLEQFFRQYEYRGKPLPKSFHLAGTRSIGTLKANVLRDELNEIWIAKSSLVPSAMENFVCAFYKCNCVGGLLIKFTSPLTNNELYMGPRPKGANNSRIVMLETLSCRNVSCKRADFAVPSDYRKVMRTEEVMTSKKSRQEAGSIFFDMGLGNEFGTKR